MEWKLVHKLGLTEIPLTSREPATVYGRRALFFFAGILTVATLCLCATVLILSIQASSSWIQRSNPLLIGFVSIGSGLIIGLLPIGLLLPQPRFSRSAQHQQKRKFAELAEEYRLLEEERRRIAKMGAVHDQHGEAFRKPS
jgi:hypothetical protein